ncbi:centriolin-like [Saccoglossus kowalevskii]
MNRSGGRLTPTQKYATRRESPILLPHAESDTSLNRRGILSPHSADNVKDGKAPRNLVRYITETLIKKLAKEESLDQILSLNLTLSKEGGKKIKYIENLELLRRLQVLSLSCNIIEKIEKLDKLTKLRELNLSFNCITKIEGLENLVHLQVLNLTGNQIEHIPTWLAKKLKELQTFRIAKNKLATLQEISRLRPLKDMVQLNVSDNPLCELPHSRLFIVFQLRTLEILDGQSVDIKERQAAQERFEQEEIENLADRLEKQEKKSRNLEEEKTKSLTEIKHKDERVDELKKKEKDSKRTIKELQKELETKDELLKRKTSELTKACQKHYRLEQELAFYKIDAKFESLGQFPQLSQSGDEGGLEESPYIGKARYKRSGTAGEKFLLNKAQPVTVQKLNYDEPDANPMNQQIKDRIHQALDNQLVDKEQNIGKAQERLLKLQDELHNTEQQILDATQELRRIAQATPQRPLTEEDKQQIRNRLAKKMRTVNTLRDRASEIEDEMGRTKHYMQREEKTIADLLIEMEKLGEDHPQYATNDSLKDRLRGQQKQIDEVLHNSIRPEDIVKRLHEMTVNLDDGDEITPYSDRDILGKTLSELQQQLKDKLKQSNKEKEQARKRQEKRRDHACWPTPMGTLCGPSYGGDSEGDEGGYWYPSGVKDKQLEPGFGAVMSNAFNWVNPYPIGAMRTVDGSPVWDTHAVPQSAPPIPVASPSGQRFKPKPQGSPGTKSSARATTSEDQSAHGLLRRGRRRLVAGSVRKSQRNVVLVVDVLRLLGTRGPRSLFEDFAGCLDMDGGTTPGLPPWSRPPILKLEFGKH